MNELKADVYKQDTLAGHFFRTPHTTEFRYSADYLDSHHAPVATTLPLTDEPFVYQAGALPPFFTGLLPEGRRLTSLRNVLKVSKDDELSLLLAVGADTVGDVRVLPPGVVPDNEYAEPITELDPTQLASISFADFFSAQGLLDYAALPGVQDKVSGKMLTIPLRHNHNFYLLKLTPPEYPLLVENEHFFLEYARRISFRNGVVSSHLVRDITGRSGLLIQRFDRGIDGNGHLARYAVEDACQLLNLYPADKYEVTALRLAQAVVEKTSQPILVAQELVRQFAFAWLTGNGDLHAKNISIIESSGKFRLAPVYDIPSTAPYGDQSMALKLLGKERGLSAKTFLDFGQELGVRPAATALLLRKMLHETEELVEGATGLPFDSARRKQLVKILKNRRLSLSAGL